MISRTRKLLATLFFIVTFIMCYAVLTVPADITDNTGRSSNSVALVIIVVGAISFSIAVFTLIKNKLIASLATVAGLLLLGVTTFLILVTNIGR
jgi:uncharacterized membrane protein SpoIIM required for sporulation